MVRYIREEEIIAQELKKTRRGVADVQRPTGTERRRTADKADQLEVAQAELAGRLGQAEEDLSGQNQRIEEAEQKAEDAFFNADQAKLDAAAALAAAESATGPNAVVDPGLEHPSMWEDRLSTAGARFSIVESGARSGTHALQAVEGSEDGILTLGSMPVKVGTVIRFVVWVNTPAGMNSSERPILEFYDQNGTLVRSLNMPASAAAGEWAQWSTSTSIAPTQSSVTNVEARLRVRHTTVRTVLFDDFEIVDYTQAQELVGAVSGAIQGKPSMFYRSDAPTTGTYAAVGSTWFQTDADGNIIAQFQQTAATVGNPPIIGNVWEQTEITSEAIANLDVGKLRAGDAELDDVVAQSIAAKTGQYIELDVAKLIASDAVLDEAVANKIWSEAVVTELAIAQEVIAGSAFIRGSIEAGALSADAIDGMEIRGAYIEGPVIASSPDLGTGSNVLNDPELTSTVDTAWVASGFLGDADKTQRDTISWDQTWRKKAIVAGTGADGTDYDRLRNKGTGLVADMKIKPVTRQTGSLLFRNSAWMQATPRTITDPYTFHDILDTWYDQTQAGGMYDPSFKSVDVIPTLAGEDKTTYLTNSASISIVEGDLWQYRLGHTGADAEMASTFSITLELVNNSGVVRWSRELNTKERTVARDISGIITATFTDTVKFRVKATYRAAGGGVERRTVGYGKAQQWQTSKSEIGKVMYDITFDANQMFPPMSAPSGPLSPKWDKSERGLKYWNWGKMQWGVTSAMFSQSVPEKGFRLDVENGFQLYNSLGALTGRLNGEDNFLAGKFATAESGARVEIDGGFIKWFDQYEALQGGYGAGQTTDWNSTTIPGSYWAVNALGQPLSSSSLVHYGSVYLGWANGVMVLWQEVRYGGNDHDTVWRRYRSSNGSWNVWVKGSPATGTYTAGTNILAGEFFDQTITFPAGQFNSTPRVVAGTNQVRVLAACTSKSTTQATIRVFNVSSGTAAGTCTVDWIATA